MFPFLYAILVWVLVALGLNTKVQIDDIAAQRALTDFKITVDTSAIKCPDNNHPLHIVFENNSKRKLAFATFRLMGNKPHGYGYHEYPMIDQYLYPEETREFCWKPDEDMNGFENLNGVDLRAVEWSVRMNSVKYIE